MRKGSLVGSGNEYEAGHVMSYHVNHTDIDNKDPDNNVQFYLGICAVIHKALFAYFAAEHVSAFKHSCFSRRFSERALSHYMDRMASRFTIY